MGARNRAPSAAVTKLSQVHRDHIQASMILRRLTKFVEIDPDRPRPDDVRMTRTQVHVALALLRKVLPDLASVEVSGNPDKPLMVQVVRFSDGEQLEAPRPVLDMSRLIELDATEARAIEAEAAEGPERPKGRKNNGRG
jgi:hypothetical protein